MVNAPKQNFLLLEEGKYHILPTSSTRRNNPDNEGKTGFEAERV